MSRFRISLWNIGASRGRGTLQAVIDDAKDIGASEFANDGGELFFTLPWNHPQIDSIVPLQRHYEVKRRNSSGVYVPIFTGLIDDFDATDDEVVVYGRDYLSLLDSSITASGTSYASTAVGTIISAQLSSAIAETNSRVAFITAGTIETTSTTATVLSSFQSRLEFISSLADIVMSNSSVRSIIRVTPKSSATPSFTFTENDGSDISNIRLQFGGLVNGFRYAPGYGEIATTINAIGQKREGASILYSTQTYASPATYGHIASPRLLLDAIDQAALDKWALREARRAGRVGKGLGLAIRTNQLGPGENFDIADSLPVYIDRGLANVDALYTVWGWEWIGRKDGSEELFLSLLPKDV